MAYYPCLVERLQTLVDSKPECEHTQVREVGQDFDQDGRLIRLVRCLHCGLLMERYLRTL